jgi:hypothetical protein
MPRSLYLTFGAPCREEHRELMIKLAGGSSATKRQRLPFELAVSCKYVQTSFACQRLPQRIRQTILLPGCLVRHFGVLSGSIGLTPQK